MEESNFISYLITQNLNNQKLLESGLISEKEYDKATEYATNAIYCAYCVDLTGSF